MSETRFELQLNGEFHRSVDDGDYDDHNDDDNFLKMTHEVHIVHRAI